MGAVAKLEIDFHITGARSLKDKRQRLARLRDKFGRQSALAVCESDFQDSLQRAQWTFVGCAASARVVEQALAEVEQYVSFSVDAEIIEMRRSWL